MSDISRRQRLHRHMHNEMQTLEIVAQNLADFPEAPWELRMELARQCWDESRHSAILYRRLREMGGRKGEFPVMNYEWGVTQMLDSLPARLAVQNRTFEGGEMDLLRQQAPCGARRATARRRADGSSRRRMQHVRFATGGKHAARRVTTARSPRGPVPQKVTTALARSRRGECRQGEPAEFTRRSDDERRRPSAGRVPIGDRGPRKEGFGSLRDIPARRLLGDDRPRQRAPGRGSRSSE